MFYPRTAWFIARHGGRNYGPEPTWRTASIGAKIAALAVLAMLGSFAAVLSIPLMALISYAFHQL